MSNFKDMQMQRLQLFWHTVVLTEVFSLCFNLYYSIYIIIVEVNQEEYEACLLF